MVDLCGKASGFADFENTVDRGSAVTFDTDVGLCLMFGSWVLNKIWITDNSSALLSMLMCSSKLFLFIFQMKLHLNSGVRLMCFYWNCTVLSSSMLPFLLFG